MKYWMLLVCWESAHMRSMLKTDIIKKLQLAFLPHWPFPMSGTYTQGQKIATQWGEEGFFLPTWHRYKQLYVLKWQRCGPCQGQTESEPLRAPCGEGMLLTMSNTSQLLQITAWLTRSIPSSKEKRKQVMQYMAGFSLYSCDCISVWDNHALYLHLLVFFGHRTIFFLALYLKQLFVLSDDNIFGNWQPLGIPVCRNFCFCHYSTYLISDSHVE